MVAGEGAKEACEGGEGMEGMRKGTANHSPLTPLQFLVRAASVHGDRTSIVHGATRYTWSQTFDRCLRLASALSLLGISHGDVVAVLAPNIPAMYELHFGIPMAGAILNTLNIRLDAHTLSILIRHSEAKALVVDHEYLHLVHKTMDLLSSDTRLRLPFIVVITEESDENSLKSLLMKEMLEYETLIRNGDPQFQMHWPSDEWETIALNYTSGTTSNPKGVTYHHRGAFLSAVTSILMWGMKEQPVYLWTVPMFHCNGWGFTWAVAALAGINVCLRHVTAKDVYDALVEHNVTHLCGAPVVLNILASAPPDEVRHLLSKIDVITGGAPPPPSILARMEELGFNVTHSYGLTETYGPALFCTWKSQWDLLPVQERARLKARQGVPHFAMMGADVKDPTTMNSVPFDGKTMGEVMLQGSTIMKGYLKDDDATEKVFEGGWLHTGDLGVIHPDGYIQLKDRSKDIIISGGENISSIELESVLYTHPQILEAAVVACPDEFWGETPCAFVQLRNGVNHHQVSAESIIAYCRDHLPHYMAPRSVVFGPLPKTATGKIQKYILRERAKSLGKKHPGTSSKL